MLTQLVLSGSLKEVKAVILGTFTHHVVSQSEYEQLAVATLSPLSLPIYGGFPVGHAETNKAFRYGEYVRLDKGSMVY
jgi:muramoyltetrapeptide carboxypeptidase LdcA involved in peptidoglycan recycling